MDEIKEESNQGSDVGSEKVSEDFSKESAREDPVKDIVSKPEHHRKPASKPAVSAGNEESDLLGRMRENPWVVSTVVLGVIVLIFLVSSLSNVTGNTITGKAVGVDAASDNLLNFVQANVPGDVEILSIAEYDNYFYQANLSLDGQELPVLITKDGKHLVSNLIPLEVPENDVNVVDNVNTGEKNTGVSKSDKPVVELFVMTHCPYGTQAEKGMIPALEALGDEIDGNIRFVHYFMHEPEETETPIQVCLREEQSDKFLPYLRCFLEDGNSDRCLTKAGVDQAKLDTCISSGKADEYYEIDSNLSQSYGVRGSPTLVINGAQASSGRDSQSYLDAVCSAFNTAPEICTTAEVSSSSPTPGFGWEGTGSDTGAQC
jgi:glutaredoxin